MFITFVLPRLRLLFSSPITHPNQKHISTSVCIRSQELSFKIGLSACVMHHLRLLQLTQRSTVLLSFPVLLDRNIVRQQIFTVNLLKWNVSLEVSIPFQVQKCRVFSCFSIKWMFPPFSLSSCGFTILRFYIHGTISEQKSINNLHFSSFIWLPGEQSPFVLFLLAFLYKLDNAVSVESGFV